MRVYIEGNEEPARTSKMNYVLGAWPIPVALHNINPLHAKIFGGNKNIYLHFMSFFHIDMTQVVGIVPQVRQGPAHSM